MKNKDQFGTVPEYIALQPAEVRKGLNLLRSTILRAAPRAEEIISYNMPAYRQHGVLVYFAAAKMHYGFYPTASPIGAFREKLGKYKTSKGAIQFPIGEPIPVKLVSDIVKFRIREDKARDLIRREKKNQKKPVKK